MMRSGFHIQRVAILTLALALPASLLSLSAHAARHHSRRHAHKATAPAPKVVSGVQTGPASWYGPGFHGRRTASGERFNRYGYTLAHRGLPFGTVVRVTNLRTGRSAIGRVTDRGPYAHGRIADLSEGLAKKVGMQGVAPVKLEVVKK